MIDFLVGLIIILSFITFIWFSYYKNYNSSIKLDKEDLDAVSWDDNKQHTEQDIR
jgi:hypothetical protein